MFTVSPFAVKSAAGNPHTNLLPIFTQTFSNEKDHYFFQRACSDRAI
jgi:hypothetical protein